MIGGALVPAAGVRTCTTPPCDAQYRFHDAGVAPWAVAVTVEAAIAPSTSAAVILVVLRTPASRLVDRAILSRGSTSQRAPLTPFTVR